MKGKPGNLYHLRYQVENSDEYIIVATTRPETMLGDSGVAKLPSEDEQLLSLISKNLILPIVGTGKLNFYQLNI